jgi:drug/metabolite transporter (DMT)-like permease
MNSSAWVYLLISAVSSIAISHSCYYAAIKRIGATIPSLVILALPFLILLVSRVIFNERLSAAQWVFGLLLVAGAALAVRAQEHLKK